MTKRAAALTLSILLILPVLITAGGSFLAQKNNGFEKWDEDYRLALKGALDVKNEASGGERVTPPENRYIVKFTDNTSLSHIEKALKGIDYTVVGESESRLFTLSLENENFLEENKGIIEYAEADVVRSALATVNDPVSPSAYEAMGIYSAWDTARGSKNVIVAVLDTGVARNHEDLAGANILAGYDAISRKSGVNQDSSGHGTAVIGLIAATANNGLGFAGVAHGVTILPIKVSSGSTNIYSSDLVRGIRFAADAGAKVINMSIGGYSHSYAEQEAINYAKSKGCILIAAAGNGGNSEYADQLSYPASYEGVVSVGSCNDYGERSSFSQRNDRVDIAAPGENLTLPYVDSEGNSVYRTDSGTSYSCAFVSGVAALAASQIGNSGRFESEEFVSLYIDACGAERYESLGYGLINAEKIAELSKLPIITGVVNGGSYSETVTVGFNRGNAVLDDESFEDGETIVANGHHILTVTDGSNKKTVKFRLDHTPLSYKFRELSSYAYFEFERGNATLNGFPYSSKEKITASGVHEFILTDGDEKVSKTVTLEYFLPTVYGIADGKTYNRPVEITTAGEGDIELNGIKITTPYTLSQSGSYTLTVKSGNGGIKKDYKFTIDYDEYIYHSTDYENGIAAVDSTNGYICLYGDSLVGARIYDINKPEKYKFFLPVGRIYSHAFVGNRLYLFGDDGVTVLDRKTAANTKDSVIATFDSPAITYYTYANGSIFGFGGTEMYIVDLDYESTYTIAELGFTCDKAFYYNDRFYLLSNSDSILRIYNLLDNSLIRFDLGVAVKNAPVCFGAGHISVGNKLFNAENGELVFEFAGTGAVRIAGTRLYTKNRVFDFTTGKEIGSLPFAVSCIVPTKEANWIFGVNSECASVKIGAGGVYDFGGAARKDKIFSLSEQQTEYRTNLYYDKNKKPLLLASSQSTAYMLFADSFAIYRLNTDTKSELAPIYLKYKPQSVSCYEGFLVVSFTNAKAVYIASEDNASQGKYITLSGVCSEAALIDNKLFLIVNGRLVALDINTETVTETEIPAKDIEIHQGHLYVLYNGVVSKYDATLNKAEFEIKSAEKGNLMIGNGIALGKSLYDKASGRLTVKIGDTVLEHKGNVVVTKKGVYDLNAQQYFGSTGVSQPKFATIGKNNSVVAMGNGSISVNYCAEGEDITTAPNISGIENFGAYPENTKVVYDHGVGYIDGVPHKSGQAITETGAHVFSLSLPCGRNVEIRFNIEAKLSKIEFLTDSVTVSVGERITLHVVYLPEGARSVPVTYKYDSSGIEISENGEVVALAVGRYKVTAQAEIDGSVITAQTVITVRDDLIAFTPESGLFIDRNRLLVLGIAPGTKASELTDMLSTSKAVSITDESGMPVKGYVGTGNTISLTDNDGNVTDLLYAVIRGDNDGDGFITAYDLYVQERVLKGYQYSAPFVASADTNGNGILADNDYRTLKKMLFGRIEAEMGTPESGLFGSCSIQTLSSVRKGDIIEAAVCINGAKYTRGVYGHIDYSDGLEFLGGDAVGWESECFNRDGVIRFYAFDEAGKSCDTPFKVLLTLRFKVTAESGESISLNADGITVSYENRCEMLSCKGVTVEVSPKVYSEFSVAIPNANDFEFDLAKHDYEITVPFGSALADILVTHKENQRVSTTSYILSDSGTQTVVVTITDENGVTEFYNFNIKHGKAPIIDNNCRLHDLEVEGHKLSPVFDPDFFEYSITVPHGTEKINVYCVPQNPTATAVVSDTTLTGETTDVTVTVGAPDGESLTYTIHVKMLPPEEAPNEGDASRSDSDLSQADGSEGEKSSAPIWIAVIILLLGGAVALTVYKRKTK